MPLDPGVSFVVFLTVLAVVLALLLLVQSVRAARALAQMRRALTRMALGHLQAPADAPAPQSLADLADDLDRMARRLDERLQQALRQRGELEAVLASMVEGVLALDRQGKIIRLNQAAAGLLHVDPADAVGRSTRELIHLPALHRFIDQALSTESPQQGDVELTGDDGPLGVGAGQRHLQAQAAPLRDAMGKYLGVLLVLHDVTRTRLLEQVRREFVANVSHEIKTPVAAIQTAAETLLEGNHDPADQRRFLEILARQAGRLNELVEDVLTLARIEQDAQKQSIELTTAPLAPVLEAALESCQLQASAKQMTIAVECDPDLEVPMHAPILEQAVINLLGNAVKYSPAGSAVRLEARLAHGNVDICVSDQGPGIEAQHLPRIFERFYRPDRARNRAQGGTGLGLAIVKHSAQAHGGRVSVESTPGKGSRFHIHLPA